MGARVNKPQHINKYKSRWPHATDEEWEVAAAIYKAELLRRTLAREHLLKRDKVAMLFSAIEEATEGKCWL
jgi:hypothetical protein